MSARWHSVRGSASRAHGLAHDPARDRGEASDTSSHLDAAIDSPNSQERFSDWARARRRRRVCIPARVRGPLCIVSTSTRRSCTPRSRARWLSRRHTSEGVALQPRPRCSARRFSARLWPTEVLALVRLASSTSRVASRLGDRRPWVNAANGRFPILSSCSPRHTWIVVEILPCSAGSGGRPRSEVRRARASSCRNAASHSRDQRVARRARASGIEGPGGSPARVAPVDLAQSDRRCVSDYTGADHRSSWWSS